MARIPLARLKPTYVRATCTSTRLNPSFKDKPVPYAWSVVLPDWEYPKYKHDSEARWPDVTVSCEAYEGKE